MKRIAFLTALGAVAFVAGCGSGRRTTNDGGIHLPDTGPASGHDSGPTSHPDSGGPPAGDAGTRQCQMNLAPFPAALAPRCSAATMSCIMGCSGSTAGTCINNCVMADTTPGVTQMGVTVDCAFCLGYAQDYCIEQNGGGNLVHALDCCEQDHNCMDTACVMTNCASEQGAVYSAANPAAGACLSSAPTTGAYAVCFGSATGGDGGVAPDGGTSGG